MQKLTNIKIKLGRLYEFLEPFILEIENISFAYPASKDHHHSEEEGLFMHSLEVTDKMLDIFLSNPDIYLPRYENELTGEYQSRYEKMLFHVALTGLLHDIGKIGAYEIQSRWYYIPFITSLRDVPQGDFELIGNKGVNYINSTHLSGMAFGIILERAGRKYYESFLYDFRFITMMLEAIALEHYKILLDNPILQILKKADGMSVAEERNEPFIDSKADITETTQPKEIDLAKLYVDYFKQWTRVSTDFYFYSEDCDCFLILNPALHKKLVEQVIDFVSQPVSEDTIIDELIEKGYTDERIIKLSVKLPSGKTKDFSVLKIKANKVFAEAELQTRKFKTVSIETQKINETEL